MKRLFLTLLFLITAINIQAETDPKIYLATIGPGDELFLRWGHFAIVVDYEHNKDRLYDYGNFTFQDSNFIPNFIKGVMTYFKYRKSADYELTGYMAENRTITLQELNLTENQVKTYVDKLNNEVRRENMFYQYDHYYNNCVSQMSDFLDELTEGEFYKGTSNLTGRSFRDYSRDYVSSNYIYNTLIMFVLGSKVDYNISIKEALFLPDSTRDRADEVMISDDNGGLKPLIKSKEVIYQSVGRDPVIHNAKPKIFINLLVGIGLAFISVLFNRKRISAGISSIVVGFTAGLGGSILFFMAFFTGHYYIHNNWNLIMVNPLSLLLLISGIMKLSTKWQSRGWRLSTLYIDITLILTVIMIVLKNIGLIIQDNGEIIALITPLLIVNSSFIYLFKNQLGKSIKFSVNPLTSSAADSNDSLEDNTTTE